MRKKLHMHLQHVIWRKEKSYITLFSKLFEKQSIFSSNIKNIQAAKSLLFLSIKLRIVIVMRIF